VLLFTLAANVIKRAKLIQARHVIFTDGFSDGSNTLIHTAVCDTCILTTIWIVLQEGNVFQCSVTEPVKCILLVGLDGSLDGI
jgi:hypothetical protein